jgi:hypothetical protein
MSLTADFDAIAPFVGVVGIFLFVLSFVFVFVVVTVTFLFLFFGVLVVLVNKRDSYFSFQMFALISGESAKHFYTVTPKSVGQAGLNRVTVEYSYIEDDSEDEMVCDCTA